MLISKKFRMECAHQLPHSTESERKLYGKCSRLHGHSYILTVFIEGEPNVKEGWIINFDTLGNYVKANIEDVCDHQFLNEVYPTMIPTAENLGLHWGCMIHTWLENNYPHIKLNRCEVLETEKCVATVTRDDVMGFLHGIEIRK